MKNDFLEYYGSHSISPVKQDISDIGTHYERRRKLYMQCGIPIGAFKNASILEVGPGGGYNTLAFFHWGSRHVDLVEANPKGREDMDRLFKEQNISPDKFQVFPCRIEDYQTEKKYDIVIAEGFLQYLENQREVIQKLQALVKQDGIVVITCTDYVGSFVEIMKRLVGMSMTADMPEYSQKVKWLADFFAPQLSKLKGVSRSPEEYVQDNILNPACVNGIELSMAQAIDYFGVTFDVLGTSPRMFTDYSWYKNIWFDYRKDYKEQFEKKRLSLLLANMPEVIFPTDISKKLVEQFEKIICLEADYEKTYDIKKVQDIIGELDSMADCLKQTMNDEFMCVFYEIKDALFHIQNKENINMENYPHFAAAFGRMLQYISFVKTS